jgi:3-phosphoglycerate kinase
LEILANDDNYFIAGGGDTATAIFELGLENNVD